MQARHEVTRKGWGVRGVGASIKTSRLESPKVECLDQVVEVQRDTTPAARVKRQTE